MNLPCSRILLNSVKRGFPESAGMNVWVNDLGHIDNFSRMSVKGWNRWVESQTRFLHTIFKGFSRLTFNTCEYSRPFYSGQPWFFLLAFLLYNVYEIIPIQSFGIRLAKHFIDYKLLMKYILVAKNNRLESRS